MRLEVEELESRIVLNGWHFLSLFSPAQTNSAHATVVHSPSFAVVQSPSFVDTGSNAGSPEPSNGNEGPPGLNRSPSPHAGHLLQESDLTQATPPERAVRGRRSNDMSVFVAQSY